MAGKIRPARAETAGQALLRTITEGFELEPHELVLLGHAATVADRIAALDAVVDRAGVMDPETGRVHPALAESRQQRLALARMIATLRLPDQADERPQRRGALRGHYRRPRVVPDGPA